MDTFGWSSGPGHHDDVYLTRPVSQLSCGRFDLDDAFLRQLQSDVGGIDFPGGGAPCQVSSSYGAVGGAPGAGDSTTTGSMGFFGSGVDVFSSVVDGASAHDGLLDSALAFSKVLACGGEAVSNGAMFSGYSGTTACNISSGDSNNNYSGGGGHDVTEVASPTSTISPTTTSHPTITSAAQALHHHANRKLPADDYTAILTAPPLPRAGAKRKAPTCATTATSITFGQDRNAGATGGYEPDMEAMAQVKEMIYRAAAMRPVNLITDTEGPSAGSSSKPRRKNVRISSDPQTVAARLRRERVSDRLRVLQKLVPGGSKMDTASMLDEAASYLKFLKSQVQALETLGTTSTGTTAGTARLQQHYYGNNPGFLGFARNNNNSNISVFRNPNGNSAKLL